MDLGTVSGRGGSGLLSPACIEPVLALICRCRTPIPQANDTCVIFTGTPFVLTKVQQANIFFLSLYSNPHLLYVQDSPGTYMSTIPSEDQHKHKTSLPLQPRLLGTTALATGGAKVTLTSGAK